MTRRRLLVVVGVAGLVTAVWAWTPIAVDLDPLNIGIRLNLAELRAEQGERARATEELDTIETLVQRGLPVSDEQRKRISALRSRVR